ncbi:hypothetical protein SDC9_150695 [bioreactor metagenome]|uniref:Uncharacterized protein n=1 Tax=bioreactor metagenome TaxID=1076179 RepID=A0A645EN68_9ZZZZ
MKHINGSVLRHRHFGVCKCRKQEVIERNAPHIVVLDFASRSFIIDVVRRVGHHQIGELPVHQSGEGVGFGRIAADQPMAAKRPDITELGNGGLYKFRINIKIIVVDTVLERVLEQVINFSGVEARERHIKVSALQICNEQSQFVLVPFARDFIQGDIERLFLFSVHLDNDAVDLGDPHIEQHL